MLLHFISKEPFQRSK